VIGRAPRLPKTARELPGAAVLAVSAAVTEELYFRLLLPLLLVPLIGATAAFVAAALLFGAVHRHQGTAGMVATGLVGLALAGLYLGTGALWMAMMAHAILDLNALVLRPAIAFSSRGNP
jgi:membrane protease YdiL (CAAX protease family)